MFLGHILPGCFGREKGFCSAWLGAWPGSERGRRQEGAPRGVHPLKMHQSGSRFARPSRK